MGSNLYCCVYNIVKRSDQNIISNSRTIHMLTQKHWFYELLISLIYTVSCTLSYVKGYSWNSSEMYLESFFGLETTNPCK